MEMKKAPTRARVGALALTLLAVVLTASAASAKGGEKVFLDSAIEVTETEVTLPLFEGRVDNETVWFIVTEASDGGVADDLGVNKSQKLDNARGSGAVQQGWFDDDDVLHFEATVDFTPVRNVVPTPGTGFPPLPGTMPGSVGEDGYSPLVELPDGTILNAPHLARQSQPNDLHDSVVELDTGERTATIELVDGFARDKPVKYISTESSDPGGAALEAATFAEALNEAPGLGNDGTDSSRAALAAVTNGQTGIGNPERQGLNSALLGEGDPLNMLAWLPQQGRYSPLWDVHFSTFSPDGSATRQTEFADIEDLAEDGDITAPDGSAWGPTGFIVNCPIVARVADDPA